jgi:Holliday junction resolvase
LANPNGRKGSTFVSGVRDWLREKGVLAEKLALSGAKDEGDMVCIVAGKTYVFELKNHKSLNLPEFWRQAQVEAINYAKARKLDQVPLHYVIAKRRNASISQSWVIQDLEQWLKEKKA